ncbi:hypothetical protein PHLCEN_2v11304 [Hermanssonia centrifuga]|uniref:mRNA decay factor PAT1 domain-containing protein n=1 Tax=Hermanssonia centrifuga TaxID=98765 RepID=A0A2R6NKB7_9APHY|nr:hypothetical protein PHLCEN_2v11304 [Hermanssonia centrifuga]
MREAFAAQRIQNQSPSQLPLHPQGQLRNAAPQRHIGSQYTPTATPPPRMHPHSQSPRFQPQNQHQQHLQLLQQQQQLLELQELRERQQQQQLFELQEQLRMEEIERQRQQQLRAHQQAQLNAQYLQHQRQGSGGTPSGDVQYRRHQATTPSRLQHQQQQQQQQLDAPFQQSLQYLPRDIQMQQRLLAEMAQAEFLHSLQASPVQREGVEEREVQDILRAEAMRKIMEAERMEEKRRRKLEKIRYMSRYNDLMTQSDKDFITRIQVSQLVTQDPYADDFYAQVYGAHIRSRMGFKAPEALLKFGSGGGVGLGLAQVKGGRRQNAMQRMEAQVERLVTNSRLREKEKISLNSLQGALGRTAGRSYKAAPRQLLQVESHSNEGNSPPTLSHAYAHISKADAPQVSLNKAGEGAAREAARFGKEALGSAASSDGLVIRDPLSHREALVLLERLYDTYYDVDHMTESPPPPEEEEARKIWEESIATSVDKLWDGLQVMVPLETSDPHPFISLITPIKGKRMLPRIARFFDTQRMLTLLTLIVACFSQLDIVRNAPLLDLGDDIRERRELEAQTNAFLGGIIQIIEPVVVSAPMRLMSGLLALFLERNDVGIVAKSRPALALLTLFLSRVYTILQELAAGSEPSNPPSAEDIEQWQHVFNHLFQLISPHLLFLFPSVRLAIASNVPLANIPDYDTADQLVWQFLSMVAVHCSVEQQQILIATLRERILENVATATKGWTADEEQRNLRLANVNVLLNALGLDSKDIAI